MLKVPSDLSDRDIDQWLRNCYVLDEDGRPVHCTGIDTEGIVRIYDLESGDSERVDPSSLTCCFPQCGAVNRRYGPTNVALYIQRQSLRQWRRAFHWGCVEVYDPCRWITTKRLGPSGAREVRRHSEALAKALFEAKYYSAPVALEQLRTAEAISIAISPQIILCGDGADGALVYYRNTLVGGLEKGNFTACVEGYGSNLARVQLAEVLC